MTRRTAFLSLAVILATAGTEACRKKPEAAPAPATTPVSDAGASQRRADSIAAATAARRRADSLAAASAAATRDDAPRTSAELRTVLSQVVYFDYDKDDLRDDARAALDAKAAVLAANTGVTLVISGHTDERGTAEYNLALGQRRAAQVKRYLASRGVAEDRMTTQSLGDSQPASQGTSESDYQRNRRAEFEPRNASGTLVRPRS